MEIIADEQNPDFIILTETHVTKEIDENEVMLPKYDHYITYSNSKKTGGVSLYFKKLWNVTKICEKVYDYKYDECIYGKI